MDFDDGRRIADNRDRRHHTPRDGGERRRDKGWTIRVGIAAGGSFLLLLLGSLVHNRYFPGWPLMNNKLIPNLSNTTALTHYLHRVVAAALLIYLIYLVVLAGRLDIPKGEKKVLVTATVVCVVNVGAGALHVFTMVSSALLVATHLGLAGLVWSLLVAGTTMPLVVRPVPVLR